MTFNFNLDIINIFILFIIRNDQLNLVSPHFIIANLWLIKGYLAGFFVVVHEMF